MRAFNVSDYLLLHLDPQSGMPRNRQLYRLLRQAILDRQLQADTRLPSSRDLARELGVSRNTVLYAYEQLLAEGYLEARASSGTFVADTVPDRTAWRALPPRANPAAARRACRGAASACWRRPARRRSSGAPSCPACRT